MINNLEGIMKFASFWGKITFKKLMSLVEPGCSTFIDKFTRGYNKFDPKAKKHASGLFAQISKRNYLLDIKRYLKNISPHAKQITILSLSLFLIMTSAYLQDASAKNKAQVREQKFKMVGIIKTNDLSTVNAKIDIKSEGQDVYSSILVSKQNFEIPLIAKRSYTVSVAQDQYQPVTKEYFLDKDLEVAIELTRVVPEVAVAPVVVASTPAPTPEPAPVANPVSTPKKVAKEPRPVVEPPAELPNDTSLSQNGILDQVNIQRKANGLGRVVISNTLSQAAYAKAKHMNDNNYFAHTAPDGKTDDFFFINQSGYGWQAAGINLAEGDFGSATALMDAWMNSAGHKANILASYGKQLGVGICGKYYVMMIANPK